MYIYIYIYIYNRKPPRHTSADTGLAKAPPRIATDGMGTPNPNSRNSVNWRFCYTLGSLTFV